MNFLACSSGWVADANGVPVCTGTLVSMSEQEMQSIYGTALTWDHVAELQGEVITLFALVFGFLVLKKLLH